jgi:two-component system OmpR family response regulator
MRVLVVEDEPKMATLLRRGLERDGLAVDVAQTGEEALALCAPESHDVVVLDRMLPGIDGSEVCRRLRAQEVWTPVLMLTAMGEVPDRVSGLNAGADDYLTKPFDFSELLARVRALARRAPIARAPVLEVGDLALNAATHEAWRGDERLDLTPKEFALLEAFMRRPDEVLSRFALLEQVWDSAYENRSNVVDAHISALREKIDKPFGRASLQTVRGLGYRLLAT